MDTSTESHLYFLLKLENQNWVDSGKKRQEDTTSVYDDCRDYRETQIKETNLPPSSVVAQTG